MKDLEEVLERMNGLSYEDHIYRFYHGSFKVYWMQELTELAVTLLRKISPHDEKGDIDRFNPFCRDFDEIYSEGTGWEHQLHHNQKWTLVTRPIVEAFSCIKTIVSFLESMGLSAFGVIRLSIISVKRSFFSSIMLPFPRPLSL